MDLKNWISDWFENEPKEHTKFEIAKAVIILLGCYLFFFVCVIAVVSDATEKGITIPLEGYILMLIGLYFSFFIHAISNVRILLRLRYISLCLTFPAGLFLPFIGGLFSITDTVFTSLVNLVLYLIGLVVAIAILVGIAGLLLFGIRQFF